MPGPLRLLLPWLAALAAAGPSAAAPEPPPGRAVRLGTDDGLSIAATWYEAGGEGGPAVVLLPMYGGARTSWRGLLPALAARGLSALAVDPRGHGESAVQDGTDLSARVKARDGTLFAEMHRDAHAALRWVAEEGRRDPRRVAIVGASVGASVALDVARRHPDLVAAVLALTPGPRYLGLDSVAHAAALAPGTPVAVLVHRDEEETQARPVWGALRAARAEAQEPRLCLRVVATEAPPGVAPSATLFHGIRMLGAVPLVEEWIAAWLARALGTEPDAILLDGDVAEEMDASRGGAWAKRPALAAPEGGSARAALGDPARLLVGGEVPEGAPRVLLLVHARRGDPAARGGHAFGNLDGAFALPGGEMAEGTTDASAPEGWPEPPVVLLPGAAREGRRAFEAEVRLPPLAAEGAVQAWVAFGWVGADGTAVLAPGVRRDDPSTWVEVTRP